MRGVSSRAVPWIIDRRTDLAFLVGGAFWGYLLLFLHGGLGWDVVALWFVWVALVDTPHFFGTYVRAYLDPLERRARPRLLLGSLLWLLAGPAALGLAYLLHRAGAPFYRVPFQAFLAVFGLWAYWHVVRQHHGILRLYQRRCAPAGLLDGRLERALLHAGQVLPFAGFLLRHPEARAQAGLAGPGPSWPRLGATPTLEQWVLLATPLAVGALAALLAARYLVASRRGAAVPWARILFLAAVVPLHVTVCLSPWVLSAPLVTFGAFVTVFHDVQYFALVRFQQRNRYASEAGGGWGARLAASGLLFAFGAMAFGAAGRLLGCGLELHPGCSPWVATSAIPLFGGFHLDALLGGVFLGVALHHYQMDQFLWRPSRSPTLARTLQLETA